MDNLDDYLDGSINIYFDENIIGYMLTISNITGPG
jgi:hypothetical protein